MTIHLSSLDDSEIRNACREQIESLEHWLRRLIDGALSTIYGDYFAHTDSHGNRLLKSALVKQVEERQQREPLRYPRKIDAVLLDDAVDIICNPRLYSTHFAAPLKKAFPDGREEARTFLLRILAPRNNLSHANSISVRAAEQLLCYSNDVIDSLKEYYRTVGMQEEYDAPLILKVTDWRGRSYTRAECRQSQQAIALDYMNDKSLVLRPGDLISLDVEVDPAYPVDSYAIDWTSTRGVSGSGRKQSLIVADRHVGQSFDIQCRVRAKRKWHRLSDCDDRLIAFFKILPPLP